MCATGGRSSIGRRLQGVVSDTMDSDQWLRTSRPFWMTELKLDPVDRAFIAQRPRGGGVREFKRGYQRLSRFIDLDSNWGAGFPRKSPDPNSPILQLGGCVGERGVRQVPGLISLTVDG